MHNVDPHRSRRDTAATFFALGLLAGLITGLAACTPEQPACTHTETAATWNE